MNGLLESAIFLLDTDLIRDYDLLVDRLQKIIKNSNLHPTNNVFCNEGNRLTAYLLERTIIDYSAFSNRAIHFLLDASIRCYRWEGLKKEIDHNLQEEKGLYTHRIPHLEIMRQGYREDLGLETDRRTISGATLGFLKRMENIFTNDVLAFQAGALIAFEGTAIPEFEILGIVVHQLLAKRDATLPADGATRAYIDGHKKFEIGHVQGLIDAARPYINAENQKDLVKGYMAVCLAMDNWWQQLYYERVTNHLTYVHSPYRLRKENANGKV